MIKYRNDIDGLRAYAVIAVIIFHLGFLPNGYLGVDIFFVISGFLITSIIYKDLINKNFSISRFYERRIRRIIPLLLFITTIAFIIGLFTMLPDDLENLAQSVVASNFSANNILMLITSADYWSISNEYKPLMHTWSLGIEEQYYLVYPFLLVLVSKIRLKFVIHFLILISFLSLVLFIFYGNPATRFYLLQYRFFELSIGGFFAIAFFGKNITIPHSKHLFGISAIGLLLLLFATFLSNKILIITTTLLTVLLLTTGGMINEKNMISRYFFQNKLVIYIGKISFSLYLWHQLVFAFSRYTFIERINLEQGLLLVLITFILSIVTYHFLENPFRSKKNISTRKVLVILSITFLLSTSSALYIYFIGGVYKDFPSIGLSKEDVKKQGFNFFSSENNIHINYNEKVRKLDSNFETSNFPKILVIGNSYGRDVTNILLEHSISSSAEIKYFDINRARTDEKIVDRWDKADVVIYASKTFKDKKWFSHMGQLFGYQVNFNKLYVFGVKDFGYSNGIHFNKMSSILDFSNYYANMREGTFEIEENLKVEWGKSYVSLIEPILNEEGKVRIFDDQGKFISQDTLHLTKAGAIFYSNILDKIITSIIKKV